MINYIVKPGDTLGVLAILYKTTIRTLMDDNPIIPSDELLQPNWKLVIYSPEENAQRHSDTAYDQIEKAYAEKVTVENNAYMLASPKTPVYYKQRLVQDGQIAFVTILNPIPLYQLQADGFTKSLRTLQAGEILNVYEVSSLYNGSYLTDGYCFLSNDPTNVLYDPIPQYFLEGKYILPSAQQSSIEKMNLKASAPTASIGLGPVPSADRFKITPQSFIGSGAPTRTKDYVTLKSPVFQAPSYKRPVMELKNPAGQSTRIEMRVLGFNASYANSINPLSTNAGWMVNIQASQLPVLNISGYLLETASENEFSDFMSRYHKYLQSTKVDDYYSMAPSTLFYKDTEYTGIVVAFDYSDSQNEKYLRKYTMQMMVLKEKSLTPKEINAISTVISRKNMDESTFRSNLSSLLSNVITGNYYEG